MSWRPQTSDVFRSLRFDTPAQYLSSQDIPLVCQLSAESVVCLEVWAGLASGWKECFAMVGTDGQLCVLGLGTKNVYSSTRLGYKLAGLAVSSEALFARSEDGRVFCYFPGGPGVPSLAMFEKEGVQVEFREAKAEVIQIAAGGRHQLALTKGGQVFAWGRNHRGQLGVRTPSLAPSPPVLVVGLEDYTVASVACGLGHCAALTTDGKLFTWGWNSFGQLGQGHTRDCAAPVLVEGLSGIVQVALGGAHTLARSETCVWACGSNEMGQLGVVPCEADPVTNSAVTTTVPQSSSVFLPLRCVDAKRVVRIVCGAYHSAALIGRHRPQVFTWGMINKAPNYSIGPNAQLDANCVVALYAGDFRACVIQAPFLPLRPPRVAPALQRLLEDSNDPAKRVDTIEVTVVPRSSAPVNMRLPVSLLQLRAPALLSALRTPSPSLTSDASSSAMLSSPSMLSPANSVDSSSSFSTSTSLSSVSISPSSPAPPLLIPLLECESVEAFMTLLHYLVWATCPLLELSVVQGVLDLALRFDLTNLSEACQEFVDALVDAHEATNQAPPLESKSSQPPDAISFTSLLASIRDRKQRKPVSSSTSVWRDPPVEESRSVVKVLSTVDASWSIKQASRSLDQFDRDIRKWLGSEGNIIVREFSVSLHSCLLEAWQTENELEFVDGMNALTLETIRRFVYTGEYKFITKLTSGGSSWASDRFTILRQAEAWHLPDLQDHVLAELNLELVHSTPLYAAELLHLAENFNLECLRSLAANSLRVHWTNDMDFPLENLKLTEQEKRGIRPIDHIPAGCALM